jgi:hypothetical protein
MAPLLLIPMAVVSTAPGYARVLKLAILVDEPVFQVCPYPRIATQPIAHDYPRAVDVI